MQVRYAAPPATCCACAGVHAVRKAGGVRRAAGDQPAEDCRGCAAVCGGRPERDRRRCTLPCIRALRGKQCVVCNKRIAGVPAFAAKCRGSRRPWRACEGYVRLSVQLLCVTSPYSNVLISAFVAGFDGVEIHGANGCESMPAGKALMLQSLVLCHGDGAVPVQGMTSCMSGMTESYSEKATQPR